MDEYRIADLAITKFARAAHMTKDTATKVWPILEPATQAHWILVAANTLSL